MKARRSWYLYDWANQAFALSVLAIFIPNYITTLFDTATGGGKDIAAVLAKLTWVEKLLTHSMEFMNDDGRSSGINNSNNSISRFILTFNI